MVEESIVKSVRSYLKAVQLRGIAVKFGVIFGSNATGEANENSDIDLIVVSPEFDNDRQREDVDTLWRVAARTDNRVEPIACGEKQWVEDDGSEIIEVARRTGQLITVGDENQDLTTQ